MDDLEFGTRDKRGNWTPTEPLAHAPLFAFPPRPLALLRWLPHYFLPWNLLWAASAIAWWVWIIPDKEVMKTLQWVGAPSESGSTVPRFCAASCARFCKRQTAGRCR